MMETHYSLLQELQQLEIHYQSQNAFPDPDGTGNIVVDFNNITDNSNWSELSTSSYYTITSAEAGKYIKADQILTLMMRVQSQLLMI